MKLECLFFFVYVHLDICSSQFDTMAGGCPNSQPYASWASVQFLTWWQGNTIAGGIFSVCGGVNVIDIAEYNISSSSWLNIGDMGLTNRSALGISNGAVSGLAVVGNILYACYWTGAAFYNNSWYSDPSFWQTYFYHSLLIVSADQTHMASNANNQVSEYLSSTNTWKTIGSVTGIVTTIAYDNSNSNLDLYVAGQITAIGNVTTGTNVLKWTRGTNTWTAVGTPGTGPSTVIGVNSIAVDNSGNLFAASGYLLFNFSGSAWNIVATCDNTITTVQTQPVTGFPAIAGAFLSCNSVSMQLIGYFNGTNWVALAPGLVGNISTISWSPSGLSIAIGGQFTGPNNISNVAIYNICIPPIPDPYNAEYFPSLDLASSGMTSLNDLHIVIRSPLVQPFRSNQNQSVLCDYNSSKKKWRANPIARLVKNFLIIVFHLKQNLKINIFKKENKLQYNQQNGENKNNQVRGKCGNQSRTR